MEPCCSLQDRKKSGCSFNVLVFSSHSRGRIHTSLSCAFSIYFFELDLDSLVNGKGYFLRRAKPTLCVGVRAVTEQPPSSNNRDITDTGKLPVTACLRKDTDQVLFCLLLDREITATTERSRPQPRDHGHNREITATGRLLVSVLSYKKEGGKDIRTCFSLHVLHRVSFSRRARPAFSPADTKEPAFYKKEPFLAVNAVVSSKGTQKAVFSLFFSRNGQKRH